MTINRLGWVALATLALAGCMIEGPSGPDESDGPGTQDPGTGADPGDDTNQGDDPAVPPGPGGTIGDPANADPGEQEPGPDDPGNGDPGDGGGSVPDGNGTTKVCYPGADSSYTTCFDVVSKDPSFGSGYNYASHSSPSYQPPQRFLDLSAVSASTKVSPNFTVGELMQEWKGRYGVYQTHMVDKLQSLRNQTGGALNVNSGYRRPAYNKSVGGATYSRHMYGDAADMHSSVVSLNSMKTRCNGLGADYVGMYSSHIHCDWRYSPKDEAFYGSTQPSWEGHGAPSDHDHAVVPIHDADIVTSQGTAGVTWFAEVTGFDEGAPYREWTAYDARGAVIETVAADGYAPPPEAVTVEVMVGGQVMLRAPADAPQAWMRLPRGLVQVRLETLAQRDFVQDDVVPSVIAAESGWLAAP